MSESADAAYGPQLSLAVVEEESELAALLPAWRELAVSGGNAFLTPEWYALARLRFDAGSRPFVVSAAHAGRLAGLLPLVTSGRRPARFAGASLGDRFGPLMRSDAPPGTSQALLDFALKIAGRPLSLTRVVPGDAGWDFARWPKAAVLSRAGTLPSIEFGSGGWKEYIASRSRNLRSQTGRRRRKLEREHDAQLWRPNSPAEVDWGMSELFRLHRKRWGERSERSRFDRADARNFHAELARTLARHGWLRLLLLRAGGEVVAAWYGWRLGPTVSYYQAGFDPAWGERGVGGVLFSASVEAAATEGARTYDMLLGDEDFKLRWATRLEEATNAVLGPRYSLALFLAAGRRAVLPAWRALPVGFRSRVRP